MQVEDIKEYSTKIKRTEEEIAKGIIGQRNVIHHILLAILADGNVLLEGVPGLGKTQLVKTLAKVMDLNFSRIQFTPDLMPTDITGTNLIIKEGDRNRFQFEKGPVFANLVLADEINRATPKTQSALLEAMQEKTVTVGNHTYELPKPYMVLATQNPIENEGTYPLPEAQLDRFLFKLLIEFPSLEELKQIMHLTVEGQQEHGVEHGEQHQSAGEQRHIGIEAHGIVPDTQLRPQQGEGDGDDQRQQLDEPHEQAVGLDGVPLSDGQQGGVVHVLLLPPVEEGEEQPQHHIEPHDGIRVGRNQQHGSEQAEYQRHRLAHQPQLLI